MDRPENPKEQAPLANERADYGAMGGASDLRSLVVVVYVLYFLAGVTGGITAFVGVAIAYAKRGNALGTIWHSHYRNAIVVFWVMPLGMVLGLLAWLILLGAASTTLPALTWPFAFGLLIYPALIVWYYYRIIRGLIRAANERAY